MGIYLEVTEGCQISMEMENGEYFPHSSVLALQTIYTIASGLFFMSGEKKNCTMKYKPLCFYDTCYSCNATFRVTPI